MMSWVGRGGWRKWWPWCYLQFVMHQYKYFCLMNLVKWLTWLFSALRGVWQKGCTGLVPGMLQLQMRSSWYMYLQVWFGNRAQVDNHQDDCSQPIDYHFTVGRSGHYTKGDVMNGSRISKLATCEGIYTSGCGFLFNLASPFAVCFTTCCMAQQRLPST